MEALVKLVLAFAFSSDLEPIESICFLGSKQYAERVAAYPIDFHAAKLAVFLKGGNCPLHFAIINSEYLFVDPSDNGFDLSGFAVHGNTGAVRKVSFLSPSPNNFSPHLTGQHALKLGFLGCYRQGDLMQEPLFSDLHKGAEARDYFISAIKSYRLTKSSLAHLRDCVVTGIPELREAACEELIQRGESAAAVYRELLMSPNRTCRTCALFCLRRAKVDMDSLSSVVLQSARLSAQQYPQIGSEKYGWLAERLSTQAIKEWHLQASLPANSVNERVYLIEVFGWCKPVERIEPIEHIRFLKGLVSQRDLEPQLTRAAVQSLFYLKANEAMLESLRGSNKQARIWTCYYLGQKSVQPLQTIEAVRALSVDPDADISKAADEALCRMSTPFFR